MWWGPHKWYLCGPHHSNHIESDLCGPHHINDIRAAHTTRMKSVWRTPHKWYQWYLCGQHHTNEICVAHTIQVLSHHTHDIYMAQTIQMISLWSTPHKWYPSICVVSTAWIYFGAFVTLKHETGRGKVRSVWWGPHRFLGPKWSNNHIRWKREVPKSRSYQRFVNRNHTLLAGICTH